MTAYLLATAAALLAFLGLVIRNLRDYRPATEMRPQGTPFVSICLPARNEEQNIEACMRGLLAQDYGRFELLVLDDDSDDGTAEIVARIAETDGRVRLLCGSPIVPGWAGKCHACAQLAEAASGEYLLFVDADTRAEPGLLGAALAAAEESGADLVSGFPHQVTGTWSEALVLPMLHFLVLTLLPLRQVWESASPAFCAACGQFLLFRTGAYRQMGGHAAIQNSFHDGLQLARRMKAQGGRVYLMDVSPLLRCRMYEGAAAVWNGFTRNAYEGLGSFGALAVMTVLLGGLFLAPFLFLLWGLVTWAAWTWAAAFCVLVIVLIRTLQALRFGGWLSVALTPFAVAALIAIQWGGAWRALRRRPGTWRGRAYA